MAYSAKHTLNEAAYAAQRTGRYVGGQFLRVGLRIMTAVGATLAGVSGSTGVLYFTGLLGIGTGVGLQAYLNHKDFEHSKDMLASMYRKEISSYMGMDPRSVNVQTLEQFAKLNPSIDEHIDRERNRRNVSTGVWIVAGALGFVASAALIATGSVALVAGLAGVAAFTLARPLLKIAGKHIYKIDEPTTVDIIKSLEWKLTKGQSVSQAQVMEAYISATPHLKEQIEQQFGQSFGELDMANQQRIMLQYGPSVMLDDVTQAINENRMNARELVFRVHGDISGAYPDPSYKEQWNSGVSQVKEKAQAMTQNISQKGQQVYSNVKNFVSRSSDEEQAAGPAEEPSTKFQDAELVRREARSTDNQIGR